MPKKTTGKTGAPQFASLNPAEMVKGGLPSDFRGVVIAAAYCQWDYNGAIDNDVLAVRLTIRPDEDSGLKDDVVQHWSAGDLRQWVPGNEDGERAEEGPYAVRSKTGKKPGMSDNSNFAHLMESILESGKAAKGKPFTEKQLSPSVECLIGLDADWTRVPQKRRSGMTDRLKDEDEGGDEDSDDDDDKPKRKSSDILVVSEVHGYDPDAAAEMKPKKKKAKAKDEDEDDASDDDQDDDSTDSDDEEEEEKPAKKTSKKKPAKDEDDEEEAEEESEDEEEASDDDDEAESGDDDEEEEEDASPLDADLSKAVSAAIKEAGGKIKKGKLAAAIMTAFAKDKRKSKMIERVAEEAFLSGSKRPWSFDEDTGLLTKKK